MSLAYIIDGKTDVDSSVMNPIIDRVNGDAGPLANMRAGMVNLLDYVTPSGDATANRVGMQRLLDNMAGDKATLVIPPRYDSGSPDPIVLNSNGVDAWCLDVPSGVTIEGAGAGSSFKVADDQPNFLGRIFRVYQREHVVIRNMRLDGNKAGNDASYEQNHNIVIWESQNILLEDIETVDATGDGIIVGGTSVVSRDIYLNRIKGSGNLRNPVTINEASDVWINESELTVAASSGGQAIDSEPDADLGTKNLWITNCILEHEDPTEYALATGGKTGYPRRNVHVIGCEFRGGGIFVIENDGLWFDRCFGTIDHIEAIGYSNRVGFRDTRFEIANATQGLNLKYDGVGIPTNWALVDNDWTMTEEDATLIAAWGVDDFTMRGGRYVGQGGFAIGLELHATRSMKNIVIDGPRLENLRYGIQAYRDSSFTITNLRAWARLRDISEMSFQFTPGYEFITNLVLPPSLEESSAGGINVGNGTPYVLSGTPGRGANWNCYGTPEGAITEIVGAMAVRRDTGVLYTKTSGSGNTGWSAV